MNHTDRISKNFRWGFPIPVWFERNIKYWFVMPTVVYLLLLGIFPLIFSLFLVFTSWQPGSGGLKFVGLRNLQTLSYDDRFWHSLWLTVFFVLVAVTVELLLGLVVALMLQAKIKGSHFFRLAISIPILLTPISVSHTWRLMFDFVRGPANYLPKVFGLPGVMWLGNPDVVIFTMILVDIWQWTPFVALVLLAGLEAQDVELYEAAVVDGASSLDLLRNIALPLLVPFIVTSLLLRSIQALKVFDTVFVLTGGGPGTASEVVTVYGYSAHFRTFNMGYLSALSWVLLLMTTIFFIFFARNFRQSRQN